MMIEWAMKLDKMNPNDLQLHLNGLDAMGYKYKMTKTHIIATTDKDFMFEGAKEIKRGFRKPKKVNIGKRMNLFKKGNVIKCLLNNLLGGNKGVTVTERVLRIGGNFLETSNFIYTFS